MAAIGVSAQVTVTQYYSSCATASPQYTSTVTGTITQTYCPECTGEAAKAVPSADIQTTYTTTYTQVCSTGLTAQVYTVTAPCSAVGSPLPKDYVPPSFQVVTVQCNSCPTPGPVVVTTPIATPTPPASGGVGPLAPPPAASAPAAAPTGATGPLAAPAGGAVPGSGSSPFPGGSSGPLSPPQYGAGNRTIPGTPSAGPAGTNGAPPLPKFTSAAMALGRHVSVVGAIALVVGGFYVYL